MSLFIIITKPIKGFFSSNVQNPTKEELLKDLESYPQVYMFRTLDEAKQIAEIFYEAPKPGPRVKGFYGLVAEVTVELTDMPVLTSVDTATIYNNWVNSQKHRYVKMKESGIHHACMVTQPSAIKSISHTYIPEGATVYNSNLQDSDFTHRPSRCLVM